jgi:hypothetical protein
MVCGQVDGEEQRQWMEKSSVSGWRNLAMVLWTVAAIGGGVLYYLSRPPEEPQGPSTFGAPGPDFLSGIEYVFFFFCWLVGLFVIWLLALLAEVIRERREMREILKKRKEEPRRF